MPDDTVSQLSQLSALLERGHITREEFEAQKARLLAPVAAAPGSISGTAAQSAATAAPPAAQAQPQQQQQPPPAQAKQQDTPKKKTGYWTPGRIVLGVIGVPLLLVLVLWIAGGGALLRAILTGGYSPDTVSSPGILAVLKPTFDVTDIVVDDSCSELLDYCVRVSCLITNTSTIDGIATVELQLLPEGGTPSATSESVSISAGNSTVVTHDFADAQLGDEHEGRCAVR